MAEASSWMRNAAQYVLQQPKSVTVAGVVKKVNRNCGSWYNKANAEAARIVADNTDSLWPVAKADIWHLFCPASNLLFDSSLFFNN